MFISHRVKIPHSQQQREQSLSKTLNTQTILTAARLILSPQHKSKMPPVLATKALLTRDFDLLTRDLSRRSGYYYTNPIGPIVGVIIALFIFLAILTCCVRANRRNGDPSPQTINRAPARVPPPIDPCIIDPPPAYKPGSMRAGMLVGQGTELHRPQEVHMPGERFKSGPGGKTRSQESDD